jgi:hypothetical protein
MSCKITPKTLDMQQPTAYIYGDWQVGEGYILAAHVETTCFVSAAEATNQL